jgi:non-heme chloroperoxidase
VELVMFIDLPDAQLFAVDYGAGPRTLLAHGGWAGSWELWSRPFSILSKTWRAIAYDHRGTGVTLAEPEAITFGALVDDIFSVLDALEVQSCVLAAESSGAAVAIQAVVRQPQRFSGLVLVDGLLYGPTSGAPYPFRDSVQADFERATSAFVDACVPASEPYSAAIRRWGRHILWRSPQAAAIRLLDCMIGVDVRPLVAQVVQPTLILHGDQDQIVPLAYSEGLAVQIPNGRLHVARGAGHAPTITRPNEVAGAINEFFS